MARASSARPSRILLASLACAQWYKHVLPPHVVQLAMELPRTPTKPLRPPPGRTLTLLKPIPELCADFRKGLLHVGSVVGACGPGCGEIIIKISQANRHYAACNGSRDSKHGSFFWIDMDMDTASGSQVAVPAGDKVPHCLELGVPILVDLH